MKAYIYFPISVTTIFTPFPHPLFIFFSYLKVFYVVPFFFFVDSFSNEKLYRQFENEYELIKEESRRCGIDLRAFLPSSFLCALFA